MRERLDRGKRIDNGDWVEGDLIQGENGKLGITPDIVGNECHDCESEWLASKNDNMTLGCCEYHLVHPETVGQYTGIDDKNGNKIFEGDICEYYNFLDGNGVGVIEEDYVSWISGNVRKKNIMTPLFYLKCGSEWKIIGNIHDNPELMEGQ